MMKKSSIRGKMVALIITALLVSLLGVSGVLAQEMETVEVTSPTSGETVSGIVPIVGTVDFPNFMKYDLFLKSGDDMLYITTVFTPVVNDVLANLDSRTVPDGSYQMVVRAVRSDSNYTDFPLTSFTVQNGLGAPLAHPEVPAAPLYPPPADRALVRLQNCSGFNLDFDYTSPQGFCSADTLWIMGKMPDMTLCNIVDFMVIPCEYRGTASSEDGVSRPVTYSFDAEPGKIYEIVYPGGERLFINEIPGEEMAGADSGGQAPAASAAPARPQQQAPAASDSMLPTTGSSADYTAFPFVIAAGSLLLFMVVGGVVAIQRGKKSAP